MAPRLGAKAHVEHASHTAPGGPPGPAAARRPSSTSTSPGSFHDLTRPPPTTTAAGCAFPHLTGTMTLARAASSPAVDLDGVRRQRPVPGCWGQPHRHRRRLLGRPVGGARRPGRCRPAGACAGGYKAHAADGGRSTTRGSRHPTTSRRATSEPAPPAHRPHRPAVSTSGTARPLETDVCDPPPARRATSAARTTPAGRSSRHWTPSARLHRTRFASGDVYYSREARRPEYQLGVGRAGPGAGIVGARWCLLALGACRDAQPQEGRQLTDCCARDQDQLYDVVDGVWPVFGEGRASRVPRSRWPTRRAGRACRPAPTWAAETPWPSPISTSASTTS